jgi:hypothetical protein
MARNPEHIRRRNAKIRADFEELSKKKSEKGNSIYTFQYVLEQLSKKYFLAEITIQRIITADNDDEPDEPHTGTQTTLDL